MTEHAEVARRAAIEERMLKCRHFTGVLSEVCDAGVNYRTLVGGPDLGWVTRLPCVLYTDPNRPRATCRLASYPNREESAKSYDSDMAYADAYLTRMMVKRLCPLCNRRWSGRQVGHCVYCEHCGQRLYQGELPDERAS